MPDDLPPLRLLTFNVHLFGGVLLGAQYSRDRTRLDGLVGMLRGCGADIVALAEVWDVEFARELRERLAGSYPHFASGPFHGGLRRRLGTLAKYGVLGGAIGGGVAAGLAVGSAMLGYSLAFGGRRRLLVGSGLVLLSRHPFAFEPRFRPFSMQRGIAESDRFAQKGALFAAMRRAEDGRPFDLVSTHLHAGPGRIARRARAAQLAELGELVDDTRARDPRRPLVLTGDLNVEAERDGAPTEEYRAMRSALGLSDAWRARHPDIERAPGLTLDTSRNLLAERFSPHDFRGRLDYTLYTPETLSCLEAHVRDAPDEGADLSDHYALETTLAWRHER